MSDLLKPMKNTYLFHTIIGITLLFSVLALGIFLFTLADQVPNWLAFNTLSNADKAALISRAMSAGGDVIIAMLALMWVPAALGEKRREKAALASGEPYEPKRLKPNTALLLPLSAFTLFIAFMSLANLHYNKQARLDAEAVEPAQNSKQ